MTRARKVISIAPEQKTARDEWLEAFEQDFWAEYPRKVGKFMARKAWIKVEPWDQETCDEIFSGLSRWLAYWRSRGTEPDFIPYPATWLNQHRWEDEP